MNYTNIEQLNGFVKFFQRVSNPGVGNPLVVFNISLTKKLIFND